MSGTLAKRIIPCLDVKNGKTVKGVNFVNLKDIGDPVEMGKMRKRMIRQGQMSLFFLILQQAPKKGTLSRMWLVA